MHKDRLWFIKNQDWEEIISLEGWGFQHWVSVFHLLPTVSPVLTLWKEMTHQWQVWPSAAVAPNASTAETRPPWYLSPPPIHNHCHSIKIAYPFIWELNHISYQLLAKVWLLIPKVSKEPVKVVPWQRVTLKTYLFLMQLVKNLESLKSELILLPWHQQNSAEIAIRLELVHCSLHCALEGLHPTNELKVDPAITHSSQVYPVTVWVQTIPMIIHLPAILPLVNTWVLLQIG